MCPFVRPSVICSFHSFVRGCRCPLDIISPYWPPSCCGWTPRATEGSDQRHERAQGPRRASRVQRPSLPWWGGGFEAQDPFRHDRYSPQHAEREESMGCVDQRSRVCVSRGCRHYETTCEDAKRIYPWFWVNRLKGLVQHFGKFTCCHNPNSRMSMFFPFNESQLHLHSRHVLGGVINIYLVAGRPVPFTSLSHWISKQQTLITKGNVPPHTSGGIMAIGVFAKMLNYPFKPFISTTCIVIHMCHPITVHILCPRIMQILTNARRETTRTAESLC